MNDDLDDLNELKDLFDRELPKPDPARRADAIALAMKNFDRTQETADVARQTSESQPKGIFRGAIHMLFQMNTRAVLTATTALAAVALVAVIPVVTQMPDRMSGGIAGDRSEVKTDMVAPDPAPQPELFSVDDVQALAPGDGGATATDTGRARVSDSAVTEPPMPPAAALEAREEFDADAPAPRVPSRSAGDMTLRRSTAPTGAAPQSGGGLSGGFGGALTGQVNGRIAPAPVPVPQFEPVPTPAPDTEAFPEAEQNPIKVTAEDPVSTFSIDVDTASWSIIRNSLTRGMLPSKDAVRIEEMVNYFSYDYPAPEGDAPFATHVGISDSPWREGTQIVQIGLQGMLPEARPPMNLVFLIDTSGSMQDANKLPLLKQSFRLMLGQLGEEDMVSIVTYAGSAGRVLEPTKASDRQTILDALDRLEAGGSTAGQAGLQQAYATATEMARDGAVSRVILATDGDFNVGISDPDDMKDYIETQRGTGTYLSVLGFGRGNLDDATMQALAQHGNGMAAYIDTLSEAQKVLVDQLTGALVPIADDVKIQVEWNPAEVAEYRLIGYETRALRRQDFNNDKIDAGEIGAGHQVTALYEITPVGSDARMTDPLRYAPEQVAAEQSGAESAELGFLRLRYKAPGESESRLIETPVRSDAGPLPQADWATAIAGFGQILTGSDLIGDWSMGDAIALATGARGEDPFGYRQEAINLMRLAQSLQR
ncbi:VWA domain-containing protein [Sagittula stellata]|uniref:VWFA domain-containing protein n=1 Tax=Sagittula stellata (strain ATCC 700073 / DSM 11524 / E-37) TaxID=388399 RepID=A3K900_SAGS3|nr:VWA domain-containing protein [Sagittula stellata]EBA06383.1 hypothetical protein SSE37_18135 [Sagittula stellata E-37]